MTGRKRARLLSADEIELWRVVAQSVAPRPGSHLPVVERPVVAATPATETAKPEPRLPRSVVPAYAPPQSVPRATVPPLAPIEPLYRRKVVRGRVEIERAIDLHGLNQAEAHGALRGFLRAAQSDGLRLVLVVTGKGQRATVDSHAHPGVLRRTVPHWLREPELRAVVLGFDEASQPHGGTGALYIRLRRRRP